MIVKNRYSIVLSKKNNQRSTVVNNARRRINNATTTTTTTTPPPTPEDSDVLCLNLAPGLYKKKYEGYFYDNDDFFNSKLVGQISFADIGKTYQITDAGTATEQDWMSWGFIPQGQYDTIEALGLPFPSIGKGVFYDGFGSINNAGTASVSPILVSEEVTSQIDDYYYQSQGQNNKSLIIKGYFKPTVNGVYKFRLYSDDASYLWFGNDALDGNRITADAVVSLPGIHAPYHAEGIFSMVANSYYALTVEFGNGPDGEGVLIFDYMPPGSDTWTSDLAGKLFYDVDSKGHRVCAPPSAYRGRVLSLDAVPYDRNPNQILFDAAGVSTVDGVYVYTQTGAPIFGSMFHDTGFYGPLTRSTANNDYRNNFVEFDVQYGKTGYFVGDWTQDDWTYFNTGNIPFVNRVEIQGNGIFSRANSGDNTFYSLSQNGMGITKNQNSGWDLQDDDGNTIYTNDDINLDPNGWYYNYINTITISNAGTASSNGTYTRSVGGNTTFNGPNGNYIYNAGGGSEWAIFDTQLYNPNDENYGNEAYYTEDFVNWFIDAQNLGQNPAPNGLTTTARYYPASKTDGLLGIQYSGYFDGDPTWFNTASVKPIINELTLVGASEGFSAGTYTRVGDQNNQGTSYFQGPNGWRISYYSQFPAAESYWFLHPGDYNQYYTSNDLTTWEQGPEGDTPPTATITQTQNFENSTNFGTTRALSNDTSWQWVGYFRANDTSNHNFYIGADEDAYFWIGDKALNGYTTGNADMYSIAYNSTNITNLPLISGVYYPVRLQWGHPANPTTAGLSLSYRNGVQGNTYDFSGLFFNFTGTPIATNSNGYVYDFTLGQWQVTNPAYEQVPDVYYSHVWLDSISGFNNSGVMYTGNKHVTLVNNPVYSSDYSGIYSFNGVDQYALTQEVLQSADGSISYFVWFKPTGAGTVVSELGQPQINAGWHDSQLEVMQDGKVNFGIWGAYTSNPEFKIQSTGSIDFDLWHHLGLTYTPTSASSGVLSAYINGEKIADSNCPSRLVPGSLYYGICAFDGTHMGAHAYGKGSVGSFQVYNKGLTQTEVANLYSGEKDRFPNIDNMFFPSLWLDASTGVNRFDYNYISQIVLSGNPSVTGTYNISTSVPTYNFEDQRLDNYSLGNINWGTNEGDNEFRYRIVVANLGEIEAGYESSNGINWNAYNTYISQVIITGFTGAYIGANGTYNYDGEYLWNGPYYINSQGNLIDDNNQQTIAYNNNNNFQGTWTPGNYLSTITFSNAGETFIDMNGVYTRSDANLPFGAFTASSGRYINFDDNDGNFWVTNGDFYRNYSPTFDNDWQPENGDEPSPDAIYSSSARNVGSPTTSSIAFTPSGSISGSITTSNIATDYVISWNDQSANGRNVNQYDIVVPSITTIADKKFINFSANALLAGTTFFNTNYIGTIFVVANFDSSSAGSTSPLFKDYDSFVLGRGIDSTNAFYLENMANDYSEIIRSVSNTNVNNNTNYIIGATFENNTASLYLNGVDAGNGSIGNLETVPNAEFLIGGGNGTEPANIAEVIAYNRVLNTSERQEVESYLSNKYDISLA